MRGPKPALRRDDLFGKPLDGAVDTGSDWLGPLASRKMRAAVLIAVFALAGCGIDGEPEPVPDDQRSAGIAITGEARIGVTGSF